MQIFNTTVEGVRVIDKEYNVLLVNETFSKLSGIGGEKMTGKKCHEVFNSHLCHTPQCPLTRILGSEARVECDTEVERKDGTCFPCAVTATPFRGLMEIPLVLLNMFVILRRGKSRKGNSGKPRNFWTCYRKQ